MIASDFKQPPRPAFRPWVRHASTAVVHGLGVPLVKILEAAGLWPWLMLRPGRETAADFGAYKPAAHDVVACVGAKSGTTWLLQVAVQIAFRGEADFDNIHSVVPWPDAPPPMARFMIPLADKSPLERSPTGLRVIKSHLPQSKVPYSPNARYIAVVRDPKDVIVSNYHFVRSMFLGPLMPSVRHWIDATLRGDLPLGSWAEHVASYWRVRDRGNVLFMTYEQMKQDPRALVERVARFMGVELTPAQLEAVIRGSSFAHMKQFHSKFDPGRLVPWGREGYMLRRGQNGASGELLTPAMQTRIDDHYRAELARLDCDFPYDDAFAIGRSVSSIHDERRSLGGGFRLPWVRNQR